MEEKINIDSIIKDIAERSDYKRSEVRDFLNIIINRFREFLRDNDSIEIRGLGTFYTKEHKGRHTRLRTKIIDSRNHYVTLFKESKTLQKIVNSEGERDENCGRG